MAKKRMDEREERDLLIELKTEMGSMRVEMGAVRSELKDLNSGMSARLLNLEANAVNRIEVRKMEEDFRENCGALETKVDAQAKYIWMAIGAIGVISLGLSIWSVFK